jgi:hypothetical protein
MAMSCDVDGQIKAHSRRRFRVQAVKQADHPP